MECNTTVKTINCIFINKPGICLKSKLVNVKSRIRILEEMVYFKTGRR
jgi:hypothetical protein